MEELKNVESTFYEIINVVPVSIYWKGKDGTYWGCNKYTLNMAGVSSLSQIVGKKDDELPWKGVAKKLFEIDNSVIRDKKTVEAEETPILANKQQKVFFTTKTPLFDEKGEVIGLIGVSMDITQLKNAEDKLKTMEDRLHGMTAVGANIAHELRTPLSSIEMGIVGAKRYLPVLIDAYMKAQKNNISVEFIRPQHLETLTTLLDDIKSEAQYSNTIINMLLMNIKQAGISNADFKIYSISDCIKEALRRFPFKGNQHELIKWDHATDFSFRGNKTLIVHIFFNLIKNALYFIEAAGTGEITIWTSKEANKNLLFFKDSAQGIPENAMPNLFEKFYSTTINGTGLGLAFCKMVMTGIGGDIACESTYKEFTKFILNFPLAEK